MDQQNHFVQAKNVRETLRIISMTLNEGNDLKNMLQSVLERLLQAVKLECGWIFLIHEEGKHSLFASYGLPEGLMYKENLPLCDGGCWCKDKYLAGHLKKAVNIMECRRLERVKVGNFGATNGISHHATIPIFAGEESFGLMNVASPSKTHFSEEELDLLETVAYQVGATVKRFKLFEQEQRRSNLLTTLGTCLSMIQKGDKEPFELAAMILRLFNWKGISISLNGQFTEVGECNRRQKVVQKAIFGETRLKVTIFHEVFDEVDHYLIEQLTHYLCLYFEKERLNEQRKELARLDERNRLARDLHDSVNQMLFSLSLTAKGAQLRTKEVETKETLGQIQVLSQEALKELKQLIYQLRSEELQEGMTSAIKHYASLLGVTVHVNVKGILTLSKSSEECLWRIAQEALNNVKKHSGVLEAFVEIEASKEELMMKIRDHGCGTKETEYIHSRSIGIHGMRERVEALKGTFTWESKENIGTTLTVVISNQ
ncbi:GAF domain-containing sensor histidine kinase [Halalkalibacter alkaliphilus]|uniref:histidine kinase n=1 Tax=Halalkalibacter alkaliphilus TaxID=2917993 RepID=A0A9X2CTE0_9BACI|nr:GAF domain-containing sensor histidine kinase [Halalkalibacter alkaliphilus]MCL7747903.1 GAF domain-containing sensor histidine kinase [Halalkalibacter alkaliphilus]